jgi:nitrite reductase/ring-hydroxylating ferredoxin subunit
MTELTADAFRPLGPAEAVPNDHVVPYYLEDRKARISIARVDDRLYAFDDICTCADEGCPLSSGLLSGTTITCQCHGSVFDITTGAVNSGPAAKGLQVYEVREVEDGIQIRA